MLLELHEGIVARSGADLVARILWSSVGLTSASCSCGVHKGKGVFIPSVPKYVRPAPRTRVAKLSAVRRKVTLARQIARGHGAKGMQKGLTYEFAVINERAEVDEDVLWGAVEEPRVGLRAALRLVCGVRCHHDHPVAGWSRVGCD